MKTDLLTVSKIFNEAIFRIPDYQRGYSWGKSHLDDFWNDIQQIGGEKRHYTGVITLEGVPASIWNSWDDESWLISSRNYYPYYVVDGQQRLTTIAILIHCILECAEKNSINHLNDTPINDIKRKYICDKRADGLTIAYIFGYEKDNPSYEYLKTYIFNESSSVHHPHEMTIYTKNLLEAKKYFLEKLNESTGDSLETLFKRITQSLVFNAYEISKEIDVFVAFETMNNRGKPLSVLELLKNRLIYLTMTLLPSCDDGKILRKTINESWKTAYHYLGKNDQRPLDDDQFLKAQVIIFYYSEIAKSYPSNDPDSSYFSRFHYLTEYTNYFVLNRLFTRKRDDSHLADGLPEISKPLLISYSSHLKKSVETYYFLSTPSEAKLKPKETEYLERIGRLRGYSPSYILLALYTKETDHNKRTDFLKLYEKYLFLSSLRLMPAMHVRDRFFHEHLKYISLGNTVELTSFYDNVINTYLSEDNLADTISEWVKGTQGYYGWRSVNYFFYEYESYLQRQSKSDRVKIDWNTFCNENYESDYRSIEHIYPQRPKDQSWRDDFSGYNTTQKRMLRNSLGNLLALSSPKNSSLGNKSFSEKRQGTGSVGYVYGSYSENEVGLKEKWTPVEIKERGISLLNFMEKHWGLSIGDNQQKLKALGLSFMNSSRITR